MVKPFDGVIESASKKASLEYTITLAFIELQCGYPKHPSFGQHIAKVVTSITIEQEFLAFMAMVAAFYNYFVLFAFIFSKHQLPFFFISFN